MEAWILRILYRMELITRHEAPMFLCSLHLICFLASCYCDRWSSGYHFMDGRLESCGACLSSIRPRGSEEKRTRVSSIGYFLRIPPIVMCITCVNSPAQFCEVGIYETGDLVAMCITRVNNQFVEHETLLFDCTRGHKQPLLWLLYMLDVLFSRVGRSFSSTLINSTLWFSH